MRNKLTKIGSYVIIVCLAVSVGYWFGNRSAGLRYSRDLVILYANVVGASVVETNAVLDQVEKRGDRLSAVRARYNESVLTDIGCSKWVTEILLVPESDLQEFLAGLREASSYVVKSENKCVQGLLDRWQPADQFDAQSLKPESKPHGVNQ